VLRSIGSGTNFVHQRLKAGRAMPLCWIANAGEQPQVDGEGNAERPGGRAVERRRRAEAADEADGIQNTPRNRA
jgi:hypothetical protein